MGIVYGQTHGVISDPETVLSVVITEMIPTGVKGIVKFPPFSGQVVKLQL
jgi:hypothetical protein